jgi:uncharacterized protein YdeI (BOF family)
MIERKFSECIVTAKTVEAEDCVKTHVLRGFPHNLCPTSLFGGYKPLSTLVLLLFLAGCGSATPSGSQGFSWRWPWSPRTIREIQPSEVDSTVYLKGRVGDRVPLVNGQVYQLQDDTGTIWVLTDNPIRQNDPIRQSGEQISVKGRVHYESIPLGGQEYGEAYIEEQKRWREDS